MSDFAWVSDTRVLISVAHKYGLLDKPLPTGELYAINADGTGVELLVGYRARGTGLGTNIKVNKTEAVAAFLTDSLLDDDRSVIVAIWPMSGQDPYPRRKKALTSPPAAASRWRVRRFSAPASPPTIRGRCALRRGRLRHREQAVLPQGHRRRMDADR